MWIVLHVPASANAETLVTFDVDLVFQSGNTLKGTTSLASDAMEFVQNDLVLSAGATVLATFTGEAEFVRLLSPSPAYDANTTVIDFNQTGAPPVAGLPYSVQLALATDDLPEYAGGTVCLMASPCCQGRFTSGIVFEPGDYGPGSVNAATDPAVSGTFTRETVAPAIPEPATLVLAASGALAGSGKIRRRLRARVKSAPIDDRLR